MDLENPDELGQGQQTVFPTQPTIEILKHLLTLKFSLRNEKVKKKVNIAPQQNGMGDSLSHQLFLHPEESQPTQGNFLMLFIKTHQEIMLELNPTALYMHQYWLSRISFTLSKTIANEIIIRSAKVNGRQYDQNSTSSANNSFPDSLDIHLEMSR